MPTTTVMDEKAPIDDEEQIRPLDDQGQEDEQSQQVRDLDQMSVPKTVLRRSTTSQYATILPSGADANKVYPVWNELEEDQALREEFRTKVSEETVSLRMTNLHHILSTMTFWFKLILCKSQIASRAACS